MMFTRSSVRILSLVADHHRTSYPAHALMYCTFLVKNSTNTHLTITTELDRVMGFDRKVTMVVVFWKAFCGFEKKSMGFEGERGRGLILSLWLWVMCV
ncbi:hypothetical protein Hanom_Chr09g00823191 [Helianthus anomalus]